MRVMPLFPWGVLCFHWAISPFKAVWYWPTSKQVHKTSALLKSTSQVQWMVNFTFPCLFKHQTERPSGLWRRVAVVKYEWKWYLVGTGSVRKVLPFLVTHSLSFLLAWQMDDPARLFKYFSGAFGGEVSNFETYSPQLRQHHYSIHYSCHLS